MTEFSETSINLLDRIRVGQPKSWIRLEKLYAPLITHWCKSFGIPVSDIPDLRQEVFQTIFRKIDSFKRVGAWSFRGWLKTVTLNQCRDFHRKAGRQPDVQQTHIQQIASEQEKIDANSFQDSAFDSDRQAEEKHLLFKRILELIQSEFSSRDVKVFLELLMQESDVPSIAQTHQISRNNVYKIKCRFLARIRSEFSDLVALD